MMFKTSRSISAVVFLPFAASILLPWTLFPADDKEPAEARYTKYEHEIPMRNGKKLFTAVYVPKEESKKRPILMTRTPYSVAP